MIELVNLTKIYHSENEGSLALKGISLKFPETGFVTITGESGSGKTTLLNVLSGFVTYEEGSMFIDGVDFSTFSAEDIEAYRKNDVGFVFQDYHLIESHTVLDNLIEALLIVGVSNKEAKKKSLSFLEKFGLIEHKNNKARELSSGQKQKLAIARALIKEPKIVLCDEPTANLDVDSGKIIFNILKEYAKDHLVIVSTHNYEDAQDYVTHFVRIYQGVLTSYEQIEEVKKEPSESIKDKKSDARHLSLINLKRHVPLNIVKAIFSSILVVLSLFMMALFTSNIDDSFTKIISRSVFNNVNQNEMMVMKKSGEMMSYDDLNGLKNVDHIEATQMFGLASEMNYYYREGIDYGYHIEIVLEGLDGGTVERTEKVFETFHNDLYIKSAQGVINESDLSSGSLPTGFFDIVAPATYQIGDVLTIYFRDPLLQGLNYFHFDFTVVGTLKDESADAYFSTDFVKNIDYIQYYSNTLPLTMLINYLIPDRRRPDKLNPTYVFYDFEPIYNPSLRPTDIQFSAAFMKNAVETFPPFERITSSSVSCVSAPGQSYYFTFAEQLTSDEIPAFCVYVGSDFFHSFIEPYESKISRIVIDNYANIDSVISSLTNLKYDCLSEYRSASNTYDVDKRDQRAITLIVSLISLMSAAIIYFVFGFFMEKSRLSIDYTLHLLGASKKSILHSSFIQMGLISLIGLALGIGLYFITFALPIEFLQATNLYLHFYHFIIVSAATILLAALLLWKYYVDFLRYAKKGGRF